MRTLIGGALRAVVVMVLAVALLRAAIWLLDGDDPAANADIGVGVVPLVVAAVVAFVWAFVDARRQTSAAAQRLWAVAAVVCGVAAAIRAMDSVGDAVLLGVVGLGIVGAPAYLGSVIGGAHRAALPPAAGPAH